MSIWAYDVPVARSPTTSDVFNAVAEARRREILDTLITGEKAVGAIVDDLSMSPAAMARTSWAWSRSFWSAYSWANRLIAVVKFAPLPM